MGVADGAARVLYRSPRRRLGMWAVVLGVGLLALAALVMSGSSYFSSWQVATATVVDRGEFAKRAGKIHEPVECLPSFEYRTSSGQVVRASSISYRSAANCFMVGQQVDVAVDPDDSSRVLVLAEAASVPIAVFSALAGLVMLALVAGIPHPWIVAVLAVGAPAGSAAVVVMVLEAAGQSAYADVTDWVPDYGWRPLFSTAAAFLGVAWSVFALVLLAVRARKARRVRS